MSANYKDVHFIERGRFSTVLKATNKNTNQYVALKKMWIKSSLATNYSSQSQSQSQSSSQSCSCSQCGDNNNNENNDDQYSYNSISISPRIHKNYLRHCIDREIRILKLVNNHPNIIKLITTFIEDEYVIIVFEYLNINLHQLLQNSQRNLSELECKYISKQLFDGLHGLHSNNIIHRDLKPANILFNQNGLLKIADLGQARVVSRKYYNRNKEIIANSNKHNKPQSRQKSAGHKKRVNKDTDNDDNNIDDIVIRGSQISLCAKEQSTEQDKNENDLQQQATKVEDASIKDESVENIENEHGESHNYYQHNHHYNKYLSAVLLTNEIGTRWYKSPELLYGTRNYNSSIDIWSAGCIVMEMLQNKPLFCGETDIDQLCKIFNILGTIDLKTYQNAQNLPDFNKIVFNEIKAKNLNEIWPNLSDEIIELIQFCLKFNPIMRISAFDALKHKWFITKTDDEINNENEQKTDNDIDLDDNEMIMGHDKMQEMQQEAMNLKELNKLIVAATDKLDQERKKKMEHFNKNAGEEMGMDQDDDDDSDVVSITSEILKECDI